MRRQSVWFSRGWWYFDLWIGERPIVVGRTRTRAAAERELARA